MDLAVGNPGDSDEPIREFGIQATLKRAGYLFAWGLAFGITIARLVTCWFDAKTPDAGDNFGISVFIVGAVIFTGWLNWVRFRIDAVGVHRRLTWRWTTWPWEQFATGNVQKGKYRTSFVFGDLPLLRRYLSFGEAEEGDQDFALAACLRHWVAPPLPEIPSAITLRIGAPLTRLFQHHEIHADHQGLVISTRSSSKAYTWSEVRRCLIFRVSHEHPGFRELRLELPDRTETLTVDAQNDIKQWSGPEPAIVASFLSSHTAPARVVNCALHHGARSLEEADAMIERFDRVSVVYRQIRRYSSITILVGIGFYIYWFYHTLRPNNRDWWSIGALLIVAALGGLMAIAVPAVAGMEEQKLRRELEEQKRRIERGDDTEDAPPLG